MNLPIVSYVSDFFEINDTGLTLERFTDYSREIVRVGIPSVLTIVKAKKRLRMPKLERLIYSFNVEIPTFSADYIKADKEKCGLKGSPTRVRKIFSPELNKVVKFIDGSINEKAEKLKEVFTNLGLLKLKS